MPDSYIQVKHGYAYPSVATDREPLDTDGVQNLRQIRKARGLSQTALAQMVGCSQPTIAKIERGEANPTQDMIERIAAKLEVTPALLFGMPELQSRALSALATMSPERQAAALVVLEAMARGLPAPR